MTAQLVQIIDWIILTVLIATALLFGRDTQKRGYSMKTVSGLVILTFLLLPVGLGLYMFLRKRSTQNHTTV